MDLCVVFKRERAFPFANFTQSHCYGCYSQYFYHSFCNVFANRTIMYLILQSHMQTFTHISHNLYECGSHQRRSLCTYKTQYIDMPSNISRYVHSDINSNPVVSYSICSQFCSDCRTSIKWRGKIRNKS